jgi:leader peptidase (prepilin peptidase)/N-methyltransferase
MLETQWRTECREWLGVQTESATETTPPFNLIMPRSRCPHCGHAIGALENIPILSYLWLRGRCAECGSRISIEYPLVEAFSAVLAAVVAWHFGYSLAAVGALLLGWALIALSLIDFHTKLLPDNITLPMLWLGLLFNLEGTYTDLYSSVIGAVAGYLSLWLLFHVFKLLTGKEGMGYGDFKLFALLGAWLGWQTLPLIILISSFLGATVGIGLMVFRGRDKNIPIPFGPYLALAGWVTLLWGEQITQAYLRYSLP